MRVAVVDVGTNSTRLLVANVRDGGVEELDRRSVVTRLGGGVDATGRLAEDAQERVFSVLGEYAGSIERHRCERRVAVLTSAVRDARNGAEFAGAVRERFGLDGRTLSGDEEARLTYLGATAARGGADATPLLVVDIGGGSTELVTGARGEMDFHVSTQAGVVRHSERFLDGDPPAREAMDALARDVRELFEEAVPTAVRERVRSAVAVAGTATSVAAIDAGIEPYDPTRVEGRVVPAWRLAEISASLAALPLDERKTVPGLHPDRAPTIVAGMILLAKVLEVFGLDRFEASERDILWGVAISATP
ncbi:MAG TPA: Ppx/GppA phosphatase family protein [Solirubrobacteraceae bacterium]|nr:Ppx/GppA phosphatase family protein [Solirubrobacteraceae bacterium]